MEDIHILIPDRSLIINSSKSEISNFQYSIIDKDILWFKITMSNPFDMELFHTRKNLTKHFQCFGFIKIFLLHYLSIEVTTIAEFSYYIKICQSLAIIDIFKHILRIAFLQCSDFCWNKFLKNWIFIEFRFRDNLNNISIFLKILWWQQVISLKFLFPYKRNQIILRK